MRSLLGLGSLTGSAKQAQRNAQADFQLGAGVEICGLVAHGQKKWKMGRGRVVGRRGNLGLPFGLA
jgi:hypothetical protein